MDKIESISDLELFAEKLVSANIEMPDNMVLEIKSNKLIDSLMSKVSLSSPTRITIAMSTCITYKSQLGIKFKIIKQ